MSLPYDEGSVFAVPLRDTGFAVGVIARIYCILGKGCAILGYFYGHKYSSLPDTEDWSHLKPEDAILILRFGDLGLSRHDWPVLGSIRKWNREKWPIPNFIRRDPLLNRAWKVSYSDDDLITPTKEEPIEFEADLEPNGMSGSGFVELKLTSLIS